MKVLELSDGILRKLFVNELVIILILFVNYKNIMKIKNFLLTSYEIHRKILGNSQQIHMELIENSQEIVGALFENYREIIKTLFCNPQENIKGIILEHVRNFLCNYFGTLYTIIMKLFRCFQKSLRELVLNCYDMFRKLRELLKKNKTQI